MIYIFNPHKTLQIADNVKAILSGGYLPKQKKYCGFLKMIQEGNAHIICDYRGSSFISSYQNKNIINYLVSNLELIIWCLYHKVSITRISHKSLDELSTKDKLVVFSHEHCQRILSDNDKLIRSKAHILVHLTHYFFRTNEIYENLRRMPKVTAICDTDLSESNYFQRYMPNIEFGFVRTYLPKRFIDTKFIDRDKVPAKSVAVGSCQTYKLADYTNNFMSFYNTNTLHPMRLFICKNKDKFIDVLDIRISIINDHLRKVNKNFSMKYMKLIKNMFLSYSKSNHYKTDIIKIYQDSKFVFASDEVGDLHAVSVFEAMACGCICIVKNSVTLNRLGLKNGYHFIEYDGSEMGLINALKTSLTLNEYNKIRENAYFASRSLFTYDNFMSDLISIP